MATLEADFYLLREPCRYCGAPHGQLDERNGQACVFCRECGKFLYNAPKTERGIEQRHVGRDGIAPSVWYLVAERAHYRCEICGRSKDDGVIFHVGHLISVDLLRDMQIASRFHDHVDNLSYLCENENLGMGRRTMPLHDLLVFLIRRVMNAERVE